MFQMINKKTISIVLVGVLALATMSGIIAYRSVSAAATTGEALQQNSPAPMGFERGGRGGYSDENLAAALGITVDELTAARQKAKEAAIAQALEAGLITQAQADQLKAGEKGFPFGGGYLAENGIDFDALLADALGISVEKLQAAYVQARNASIDQAVTDGKLTQEQADLMKGQSALFASEAFQSAMQSAFESAVNQAVTSGVITQAQADLILANINGMGMPGFGGFGGGPGGGHGPHGGEFGPPPAYGDGSAPDAPPAPPAATPSSGL
jgi:hypothetical protein